MDEATVTNWRNGKGSCIQEKQIHYKGGQEQEYIIQNCEVSRLGDIQKPTRNGPDNLELALEQGVGGNGPPSYTILWS